MKSGGNTAFLSVFFVFLWSLANITLNAQTINAIFGEKGTLQFTTGEVFWRCFCIYLSFFTAIFCCRRKFLPYSWKLLFLVIFSIFIFVILLFETFFKIVASYLSLFKLINSLTVEVSGILITITGEEKTSPKYPMKLAVLTPLSARRKLMYCGYIPTYF